MNTDKAAPPSEREAREMLQMAEEFLFTNYSNIRGNLKILVPIVAAFGNLVARAAVPAPTREQIEKIITMFRVSDWSDVPDLAVEEVTAILQAGATAPPKEGK